MNRLHIILGIVVLVIFLITGQFMEAFDKETIAPDLRLLMRSRHIYILFNGLIHLVLGIYLQIYVPRWRKTLQFTGSVFLMLGSILLIWAFVSETYYLKTFSGLSMTGVIISAVGVLFHAIARILLKSVKI